VFVGERVVLTNSMHTKTFWLKSLLEAKETIEKSSRFVSYDCLIDQSKGLNGE